MKLLLLVVSLLTLHACQNPNRFQAAQSPEPVNSGG
jgi:hypothetical protein